MPARDSSGRHISLLNEESAQASNSSRYYNQPAGYGAPDMMRSSSRDSLPSSAASPTTPDLMRAASYDSQQTSEPRSPITPDTIAPNGRPDSYLNAGGLYKDSMPQQHYDHQRMHSFDYSAHPHYQMNHRRSAYAQPHISELEPHPNYSANVPITERGQKRYICRFANEFSCDKTFTTSGHASRHSKIHTAEKAVPCSYEGCPKKFTRSDNMKQHLETHFKERSRITTTAGRPPSRPSPQVLTKPAGIKKSGYPSRSNSVSAELSPLDPALRPVVQHSAAGLHSPYSPLSMGSGFKEALESRPVATRIDSSRSGLDALAMAAAQSEMP